MMDIHYCNHWRNLSVELLDNDGITVNYSECGPGVTVIEESIIVPGGHMLNGSGRKGLNI